MRPILVYLMNSFPGVRFRGHCVCGGGIINLFYSGGSSYYLLGGGGGSANNIPMETYTSNVTNVIFQGEREGWSWV